MTPVVTSRPMPGTPYREHTVSLGGVELRTQMSAFTPEEIDEAVALYQTMGICTPRHPCSRWGDGVPGAQRKLPGGATVGEPIRYDGPAYVGTYLED